MDASFQQFLTAPENRVLLETYQRKEYLKALRAKNKAEASEFREKVLETDYDTQKALAPYLKIPALRNIIHTFTNDENGDIGKWACNPEVQRLFSEAKRMLDTGRLSEKDLQARLTTYLEGMRPEIEPEATEKTVVSMEQLVSALNEHLQERRLGNEKYKRKDFSGAESQYTKAKAILDMIRGQGPEEQKEIDDNMIHVLLNLSALHWEKQEYAKVVDYCSQTLESDPGNSKALVRRAKAYLKRHETEAASGDLLLLDFVKDPEVETERTELKVLLQKTKDEGKESDQMLFAKMLR